MSSMLVRLSPTQPTNSPLATSPIEVEQSTQIELVYTISLIEGRSLIKFHDLPSDIRSMRWKGPMSGFRIVPLKGYVLGESRKLWYTTFNNPGGLPNLYSIYGYRSQ